MSPPKFVYEVRVDNVGRTGGDPTHAAFIVNLTRCDPDGTFTHVPSPITESWGKNKRDAILKVRAKMGAWIADQESGNPTRREDPRSPPRMR